MFGFWRKKRKVETGFPLRESPLIEPVIINLDGDWHIIALDPSDLFDKSWTPIEGRNRYENAEIVLQTVGDNFYTVLKDYQGLIKYFVESHPDAKVIIDYDHEVSTGDRRILGVQLFENDVLFLKMLIA